MEDLPTPDEPSRQPVVPAGSSVAELLDAVAADGARDDDARAGRDAVDLGHGSLEVSAMSDLLRTTTGVTPPS